MSCQNPFWNNLFLNSRPPVFTVLVCVCVCMCVCARVHARALSPFSRVRLFATLWTVILHTPQSMGLLQARILEWAARPSSRGSSQPRDRTPVSYVSYLDRQVLYHQCHLASPITVHKQSQLHVVSPPFPIDLHSLGEPVTCICYSSLDVVHNSS